MTEILIHSDCTESSTEFDIFHFLNGFKLIYCPMKCGIQVSSDCLQQHLNYECSEKSNEQCQLLKDKVECASDEVHTSTCPMNYVLGNKYKGDVQKHLEDKCKFNIVTCIFEEMGCQYKGPCFNVNQHMQDNVIKHMIMISNNIKIQNEQHKNEMSKLKKKSSEQERIIKQLNIKIEELEKGIQIDDETAYSDSVINSLRNDMQEFDKLLSTYDQPVSLFRDKIKQLENLRKLHISEQRNVDFPKEAMVLEINRLKKEIDEFENMLAETEHERNQQIEEMRKKILILQNLNVSTLNTSSEKGNMYPRLGMKKTLKKINSYGLKFYKRIQREIKLVKIRIQKLDTVIALLVQSASQKTFEEDNTREQTDNEHVGEVKDKNLILCLEKTDEEEFTTLHVPKEESIITETAPVEVENMNGIINRQDVVEEVNPEEPYINTDAGPVEVENMNDIINEQDVEVNPEEEYINYDVEVKTLVIEVEKCKTNLKNLEVTNEEQLNFLKEQITNIGHFLNSKLPNKKILHDSIEQPLTVKTDATYQSVDVYAQLRRLKKECNMCEEALCETLNTHRKNMEKVYQKINSMKKKTSSVYFFSYVQDSNQRRKINDCRRNMRRCESKLNTLKNKNNKIIPKLKVQLQETKNYLFLPYLTFDISQQQQEIVTTTIYNTDLVGGMEDYKKEIKEYYVQLYQSEKIDEHNTTESSLKLPQLDPEPLNCDKEIAELRDEIKKFEDTLDGTFESTKIDMMELAEMLKQLENKLNLNSFDKTDFDHVGRELKMVRSSLFKLRGNSEKLIHCSNDQVRILSNEVTFLKQLTTVVIQKEKIEKRHQKIMILDEKITTIKRKLGEVQNIINHQTGSMFRRVRQNEGKRQCNLKKLQVSQSASGS